MKKFLSNGSIAGFGKWMVLLSVGLLLEVHAGAATIWTGPAFTYTQGSGNAAVDRLTAAVGITRAQTQGLYNAFSESGYTHYFSPADTEWASGELTNYASLSYTTWEQMFGGSGGGGPPSTLGRDCVVHLISDDIYLSLTLTSWGMEGAGGFSYLRSTPFISPPAFQSITRSNNAVVLNWSATIGQSYQFQYSTNLGSTNWTNLGSSITATNVTMSTTDTNAVAGSAARFYRIATP